MKLSKKISEILKKDKKKILSLFLSFDEPSIKEFSQMGEYSLESIWNNPEEDEAWAHLTKAK